MEHVKPQLAVDSHHGIYGPQTFAERVDRMNIDENDWNILLNGPDTENYWEVWDDVAQTWNCDGVTILESGGDIWLVDTDAPLGEWEFLL